MHWLKHSGKLNQTHLSSSAKCSPVYEIRLQKGPHKTYKQLARRARARFDKISGVLTELMNDPLSISLALQDPLLKGFRRAKAGDDRIIFQICKECRTDPEILKERECFDCDDVPENGIMVFDIDARKRVYKKRTRRRR